MSLMGFRCNLLLLSEENVRLFVDDVKQRHHGLLDLLLGSLRGPDEVVEVSHHRIVLLKFC